MQTDVPLSLYNPLDSYGK